MIGQVWDDDRLRDPARHRAPRYVQHRRRRTVVVGLTALALLAGSGQAGPVSRPAMLADEVLPGVALAEDRVDERASRHVRPPTAPPAPGPINPARSAPRRPTQAAGATRAETVVRYALAQVGDRYRWAAAGPDAYDCSGLVLTAYARIGVRLPHYTGAMIGYGARVGRAQLRRGDVVFPTAGHVGIYLGDGLMVHASSSRGRVAVGPVYSFYAGRRILP